MLKTVKIKPYPVFVKQLQVNDIINDDDYNLTAGVVINTFNGRYLTVKSITTGRESELSYQDTSRVYKVGYIVTVE